MTPMLILIFIRLKAQKIEENSYKNIKLESISTLFQMHLVVPRLAINQTKFN